MKILTAFIYCLMSDLIYKNKLKEKQNFIIKMLRQTHRHIF